MCINDVRQELHTLVHTQGVDGLLHLYRRLEKRGRAVPVMCRGWMANFGERWAAARTRLPKAAPGFASVIRNSQVQNGEVPAQPCATHRRDGFVRGSNHRLHSALCSGDCPAGSARLA